MGEGPYSNIATITPGIAPSRPINLKMSATKDENGVIIVTWEYSGIKPDGFEFIPDNMTLPP